MQTFTEKYKNHILIEAIEPLSIADIHEYGQKMEKKLPVNVIKAIAISIEQNILDKKTLLSSTNPIIKSLSDSELRLMPQCLSTKTRKNLISNKLSVEDIILSLKTPQDKNKAIKKYLPLVNKQINYIFNKYSKIPKSEYMSKALEIFADAINDYNYTKTDGMPFYTYLIYMLKYKLSNYAKNQAYSLSGTNWYAEKKYGATALSAVSLDELQDNDYELDKLNALADYDPEPLTPKEDDCWEKIFKLLEKKFKQRQIEIFYSYFGLNGRKKEKAKDIANKYHISPSSINNNNINPILKFLRNDPKTKSVLVLLRDMYNESLLYDLYLLDNDKKIAILESDDIYILLEELTRLDNINIQQLLKNIKYKLIELYDTSEIDKILNIISTGSFEEIDSVYKQNKNIFLIILHEIYPTEDFSQKTDIDLIELLLFLQEKIKTLNK